MAFFFPKRVWPYALVGFFFGIFGLIPFGFFRTVHLELSASLTRVANGRTARTVDNARCEAGERVG